VECFSELTYAMFVDEELPQEETLQVREHLTTCARCRELVAALRAENKVLSLALSEAVREETTAELFAPAPHILREFLTVAAILAACGAGLHWLQAQNLSAGLNWINPFSSTGQTSLAFDLLFYLQHGGSAMLEQLVAVVVWVVAVVAVLAAGLFLVRKPRVFRSSLYLTAAALVCVLPARALEKRSGQPTLIIGQNETIDDTLLARGETVEMNGVVNGDLLVSGRTLSIGGTVKGNVFTWAQNLEISGTVEGSLFSLGQSVTLRGQVTHNIYSWSEFLRLAPTSRVGFDVVSGCQRADLHGHVDRSITNFARVADVRGTIGRDLLFRGGEISLSRPARVGGTFDAYVRSQSNVHVEPGVTITGASSTHLRPRTSRFTRPGFYLRQGIDLVGALLVGLVAIILIPAFFKTTSQAVGSLWRSLGLGFAVLVGTPVAVILLAITLIGLPLAFLSLALYVIALYLAKIFVGTFLGRLLLKASPSSTREWMKALAVGLVVLMLIFQIPYGIGAVIHVATFCFGLGAFAWQLNRFWRAQKVEP
jgi:hypothetical protein